MVDSYLTILVNQICRLFSTTHTPDSIITHDDQTRVYDLSELEDPSMLDALMQDKEILKLRTEAGVNMSSAEVLSTVGKHKIW